MNQWLSAIRKTTIANPKMPSDFHPGAFHKNKWTCCKRLLRQGKRKQTNVKGGVQHVNIRYKQHQHQFVDLEDKLSTKCSHFP